MVSRFATAVGVTVDTADCVEWDGRLSTTGYAIKNHKKVHRLVWEEANGPIPKGLSVLHRCDNRPCIIIDHLFLGTYGDNLLDAALKGRNWNQKRTHCPQGHLLGGDNLYPSDVRKHPRQRRRCRICANNRNRDYLRRKRVGLARDGWTGARR